MLDLTRLEKDNLQRHKRRADQLDALESDLANAVEIILPQFVAFEKYGWTAKGHPLKIEGYSEITISLTDMRDCLHSLTWFQANYRPGNLSHIRAEIDGVFKPIERNPQSITDHFFTVNQSGIEKTFLDLMPVKSQNGQRRITAARLSRSVRECPMEAYFL